MELGPLSDDIDLTTGRSHSRPGLGPCGHSGTAEPVRLLDDGQIVAWLCGRCDTQLAADWKPAGPTARRLAEAHASNHHGDPAVNVLGCPGCAEELTGACGAY